MTDWDIMWLVIAMGVMTGCGWFVVLLICDPKGLRRRP